MTDTPASAHQCAVEALLLLSASASHFPPTRNNASLFYSPRDFNHSATLPPYLPDPQQRAEQDKSAEPAFIPKREVTTFHWTSPKDKILLIYTYTRDISAQEFSDVAELLRSRYRICPTISQVRERLRHMSREQQQKKKRGAATLRGIPTASPTKRRKMEAREMIMQQR